MNLEKMSADKDIMDEWRRNKDGDPRRKVQNLAKSVGKMFSFFPFKSCFNMEAASIKIKGPGGPAGMKEGSHENQFMLFCFCQGVANFAFFLLKTQLKHPPRSEFTSFVAFLHYLHS